MLWGTLPLAVFEPLTLASNVVRAVPMGAVEVPHEKEGTSHGHNTGCETGSYDMYAGTATFNQRKTVLVLVEYEKVRFERPDGNMYEFVFPAQDFGGVRMEEGYQPPLPSIEDDRFHSVAQHVTVNTFGEYEFLFGDDGVGEQAGFVPGRFVFFATIPGGNGWLKWESPYRTGKTDVSIKSLRWDQQFDNPDRSGCSIDKPESGAHRGGDEPCAYVKVLVDEKGTPGFVDYHARIHEQLGKTLDCGSSCTEQQLKDAFKLSGARMCFTAARISAHDDPSLVVSKGYDWEFPYYAGAGGTDLFNNPLDETIPPVKHKFVKSGHIVEFVRKVQDVPTFTVSPCCQAPYS
jgi:hypothetical protein